MPISATWTRRSGGEHIPTDVVVFCPHCGTRVDLIWARPICQGVSDGEHYHEPRFFNDERVVAGVGRNLGFGLLSRMQPSCAPCLASLIDEHGSALLAAFQCAIERVFKELRKARQKHEFWQVRYSALSRLLERCEAAIKSRHLQAQETAFVELERRELPRSVVYLISDGFALKIGSCSQRVEKRIAAHQVSNPRTLELIGVLPGGLKREAEIKRLFQPYLIRGEWFQDTPLIREYFRLKASSS